MDEYKQICLEYYQRRADDLQQRWMNAESEAEAAKIAFDLEPLMNYLAKDESLKNASK